MSRTDWVAPAIDERSVRVLRTPSYLTAHDVDPTAPMHPWDARYGDDLPHCVCCGSSLKRVVIATTTDGGEIELGWDCFQSHYRTTAGPVVKRRESVATKARKGWEDTIRNTNGNAPGWAAKIRSGAIVLTAEGRASMGRMCDHWARYVDTIRADERLTECDRASLVREYVDTIAGWRAL
jgi:hypothetical protein